MMLKVRSYLSALVTAVKCWQKDAHRGARERQAERKRERERNMQKERERER